MNGSCTTTQRGNQLEFSSGFQAQSGSLKIRPAGLDERAAAWRQKDGTQTRRCRCGLVREECRGSSNPQLDHVWVARPRVRGKAGRKLRRTMEGSQRDLLVTSGTLRHLWHMTDRILQYGRLDLATKPAWFLTLPLHRGGVFSGAN